MMTKKNNFFFILSFFQNVTQTLITQGQKEDSLERKKIFFFHYQDKTNKTPSIVLYKNGLFFLFFREPKREIVISIGWKKKFESLVGLKKTIRKFCIGRSITTISRLKPQIYPTSSFPVLEKLLIFFLEVV